LEISENKLKKWYIRYAGIVHGLTLLLIFFLSFYIRTPWLDKPLSKSGWVTAHTLITVEIWNRNGICPSAATPVYTFQDSDSGICALAGIRDKEGECYYVSYPSGGFMGPYLFFKLTRLDANEKNLRIFNMLLQFISAFFLYLLLLKVHRLSFNQFCLPALIAFILYCYLPIFLFFHSEVYFSDTLAQPLFYICIYLFLSWKNSLKRKFLILFSVLYFIFLMTEWLSVMLGITLFVYAFFLKIPKSEKIKFILSLSLISIFTGILFVLQYSSINDFDTFYEMMIKKYAVRSGASGIEASEYGYSLSNPKSYSFIEGHYNRWFLPLINLTGLLIPLWLCVVIFFKRFRISSEKIQLILLSFFPVFLHLLILFNFNAVHEMGAMKVAGFLVIMVSLTVSTFIIISQNKIINSIIAFSLFLLIGFKSYQSVIIYNKKSEELYSDFFNKRFGDGIQAHSTASDLIMVNIFTSPELIWHAKRNPSIANNLNDAQRIMTELNKPNAVYFEKTGETYIYYRLAKTKENEITVSTGNF